MAAGANAVRGLSRARSSARGKPCFLVPGCVKGGVLRKGVRVSCVRPLPEASAELDLPGIPTGAESLDVLEEPAVVLPVEEGIRVRFELPFKLDFGQEMFLCGDSDALGSWSVSKGKRMRCEHEGERWTLDVQLTPR